MELARVKVLLDRHLGRGRDAGPRLRAQLEASVVNEAELVFSTLSTAGQAVFRQVCHFSVYFFCSSLDTKREMCDSHTYSRCRFEVSRRFWWTRQRKRARQVLGKRTVQCLTD